MARIAVLALVLAALAGCGGSDDGPSEDEFASNANRICREGEAELADVVEQVRSETAGRDAAAAAADVLERGSDAYRPYMDRLRRLEAPADLREDWTAFLDGVQEAFDLFPRLAEATRSGDRQELSELATRFDQIAGDTRPFAQQHGLDDCLPDEPR
jgi:hypothetical protein